MSCRNSRPEIVFYVDDNINNDRTNFVTLSLKANYIHEIIMQICCFLKNNRHNDFRKC